MLVVLENMKGEKALIVSVVQFGAAK